MTDHSGGRGSLAEGSPGQQSVPANIQTFENSQWGGVRTFAPRVKAASPDLGNPSSSAYKRAAVASIRATAQAAAPSVADASPLAWNRIAGSLPPEGQPPRASPATSGWISR